MLISDNKVKTLKSLATQMSSITVFIFTVSVKNVFQKPNKLIDKMDLFYSMALNKLCNIS